MRSSLNTIAYYDRILVMDAGEVAEYDVRSRRCLPLAPSLTRLADPTKPLRQRGVDLPLPLQ
jgi:hypothetical protein